MKKYTAELLGSFALVFCGTGAMVIDQQSGGALTHTGVALTFGLVVMVLIHALGPVSGAHLNPAVTLAFMVARRLPGREALPYISSQLAGAFLASAMLRILFPANETLGATLPAGTAGQSALLELILSFFLMFVILQVAMGSKEQGLMAGISIGATVGLEALFAGPVCGASMNPARSLAPALVSGHTEHLWIYLAAPVAGALLAIPVWKYLQEQKPTT